MQRNTRTRHAVSPLLVGLALLLAAASPCPAQNAIERALRDGATPKPIPLEFGTVTATWDGEVARFTYDGPDALIRYYVRPSNGAFGIAGTFGPDAFDPCRGARVSGALGTLVPGSEIFDGETLSVSFDGGAYQATYTLDQKTLVITFTGSLDGVSPGKFRSRSGDSRSIYLPFSGKFGVVISEIGGQTVFATSFQDFIFSRAQEGIDLTVLTPTPQEEASYAPSALGPSSQERAYLTVSGDIHEVLPDVPFKTGDGVAQLASMLFYGEWDGWQSHCAGAEGGDFVHTIDRLAVLAKYRCDEVYYIRHDWEHCDPANCRPPVLFPCDNNCGAGHPCCPDHRDRLSPWSKYSGQRPAVICDRCCADYPRVLPPDAEMGGRNGLIALSEACAELGYLFGVRTLYHAAFGTPDGQVLDIASFWEPTIHDVYATTMSMQDVITAEIPESYDNYVERAELIDLVRTVHAGPVVGEGGHGTTMLFAGIIDAVEAEFAEFNRNEESHCSGETCSYWTGRFSKSLILDYDLLKIRPRMILQGIGYESRFFKADSGDSRRWFSKADLTEQEHDLKRAWQIAFAHAGGFGLKYDTIEEEEVVKEYYVMQQLQLRYLGDWVQPIRIKYRNGSGSWLFLEEALLAGYEFEDGKIQFHTSWDSGLEVYVNLRPDPLFVTLGGKSFEIPQHGWVTYEPGAPDFWCVSVVVDGSRVDWVRSSEYDFFDGRGAVRSIGALETDGAIIAIPTTGAVDLIPIAASGSIRGTTTLRVAIARYLSGDPATFTVSRIDETGAVVGPAAHQVLPGGIIEIDPSEFPLLDPPGSGTMDAASFAFRIAE